MPEKTASKEYELVTLYRVDAENAVQTVENLIANNGGEITEKIELGQKELAYQIAGERIANYVEYRVNLPAEAPAKISQVLNITDGVLRYLLTKVDAKAEAWVAEDKKNREKRAADRANADAE